MKSPNDSMVRPTVITRTCVSCGAVATNYITGQKCERCGGTRFTFDSRAPRRDGQYPGRHVR